MAVKAIPEGFYTVTPHLIVRNCAEAIEFYKKAFNATEMVRMPGPGGTIMHAQVRIGDSMLMLVDEAPDWGCKSPLMLKGSPVTIHLYVPDADATFAQALKAGAKVSMPLADMFWGDRYGKLTDPYGHEWSIATHKEDLSPAEMQKRQAAFFQGGK